MKNIILILCVLLFGVCPSIGSPNEELRLIIQDKGFSYFQIQDLAFAIEEIDEILTSDTTQPKKWLDYVKIVGSDKASIYYYNKSKAFFIRQLEELSAIIPITQYKFLKESFLMLPEVDYSSYYEFVNEYIKYGSDVDNVFTLTLLTGTTDNYQSIYENLTAKNNLEFWLSDAIYDMRLNSKRKKIINQRMAKYVIGLNKNAQNNYIKDAANIFENFSSGNNLKNTL